MADTQIFKVEDMSCGHCEKAITKALAEAMPGAPVTIDLAARKVEVTGDRAKAEAAIREAGYTPEAA
ncbi:heavy-metal-associated domain-containing protein [Peteryoungia desertarenae]|uniref:Heavy-metal-associated domain-containing protein n=1 Tax=Peteryoungia desertarenae TaxID=1813451 RepID=A0ABX6QNI5_9HYPH|nr:heavy-metal-associated domain-containing protein [Peteryoungia desertarenae]QLF69856.1 heavy-metal-associated domain-containing protein [Peteryoungia desertarenae]